MRAQECLPVDHLGVEFGFELSRFVFARCWVVGIDTEFRTQEVQRRLRVGFVFQNELASPHALRLII